MLMFSCLKSKKPGLPPDVVKVIDETGFNKIELYKTIAKYFESDDSLRLAAAYFLISNINSQYAVDYNLTDSAENVVDIHPLSFPDEKSFLKDWKKIEDSLGGLFFHTKKFTLDRDTISSELLISTIELSFASRNNSWAKNLDFEYFLEYVLPYKVGNEHIEDWRPILLDEFSWIIDTVGKDANVDAVAAMVNTHVNDNFEFDLRYIKNPHLQPIDEFLKNKRGNYQDISYLKAKILRSLGIPATVDYVPYLADTVNSFFFAVFLHPNGTFKPLLSTETAYLFTTTQRIPKIYRRIYKEIDSSLFAIKNIKVTTPPYLGHYHYLDVTNQYFQVQNIRFKGNCSDSLIYLSVFNDNKWCSVDWAICKNDSAVFKNVAQGPAYQFTYLSGTEGKKKNTILLHEANP